MIRKAVQYLSMMIICNNTLIIILYCACAVVHLIIIVVKTSYRNSSIVGPVAAGTPSSLSKSSSPAPSSFSSVRSCDGATTVVTAVWTTTTGSGMGGCGTSTADSAFFDLPCRWCGLSPLPFSVAPDTGFFDFFFRPAASAFR